MTAFDLVLSAFAERPGHALLAYLPFLACCCACAAALLAPPRAEASAPGLRLLAFIFPYVGLFCSWPSPADLPASPRLLAAFAQSELALAEQSLSQSCGRPAETSPASLAYAEALAALRPGQDPLSGPAAACAACAAERLWRLRSDAASGKLPPRPCRIGRRPSHLGLRAKLACPGEP